MSPSEKKSSHPLVWRVLLLLAAIIVAGLVLALFGRTLTETVEFFACCAAVGALVAFLFEWRKKQKWDIYRILRAAFTFFFAAEIFAALFLSVNILFPDCDTRHEIKTVVTKVYSETRHRSRRVGRRYVANGEEYKVYYMDVEFPDGTVKPRQIDFNRFRHTHKGDTIQFPVETGFFGVPFIANK